MVYSIWRTHAPSLTDHRRVHHGVAAVAQSSVAAAVQEVQEAGRLMRELTQSEGRGGAVRRRKAAELGSGGGDGRLNVSLSNVSLGDASDGGSSPSSLSDGGKAAAAAAGDLLQASIVCSKWVLPDAPTIDATFGAYA